MVSCKYYLKLTNTDIVRRRQERRKNMKLLAHSELELLKEAEDILFYYANSDGECEDIFYKSFRELHKAIKRYNKLEKRDQSCQNG